MTNSQRNSPLTRSWRQYSLRTLLALIFLCALVLGFWTIYVQPYRNEARIIAQLHEHGAAVTTETEGPGWLRKIAGDEFCRRIVWVDLGDPKSTGEDLRLLAQAPRLRTLAVIETARISDSDLHRLAEIAGLREVIVIGPAGSDEGLRHLGQLKQLESLAVNGSFTNAGVQHLTGLKDLQALRLASPNLTDDGLGALKSLAGLRELRLRGPITDAGMTHLQWLKNLETLVCEGDPAKARLVNALNEVTALDCRDAPLADVAEFLADSHGIRIQIDEEEFKAAKRIPAEPVTINIVNQGVRLREGLDRLLGPRGLDWTLTANAVQITTREAAELGRPGITTLRKILPKLKNVEVQW